MASLSTATNRVLTGDFVMQVALVATGIVFSATATDWMRDNVVDLQMMGADAAYGLAAALAVAFSSTVGVPWKFARPMSMGLAAGAFASEAEAAGIV